MTENEPLGQDSSLAAGEKRVVSPTKNMFRNLLLDLKSTGQHYSYRRSQEHTDPRDPTRLGLQPLQTTPGSPLVSPGSPEFDSITSLPTPVISEAPSSALSPGFAPVMMNHLKNGPSRTSPKKSYGALTTRGSLIDSVSNRNVSEYGSMNSMDRYSNASSKSSLQNPRLNGTPRSPQKRTVSTPLHEEPEGLEREEPSAFNQYHQHQHQHQHQHHDQQSQQPQPQQPISTDVLFPGIDTHGNQRTWKQIKQLGRGTFSTVILGQSVESHTPKELRDVAIKVIELPKQRDTRQRVESSLRRELDVLKALNHPSIIKLLALSSHSDRYCIITPLCEGGDLFDLAAKHRDNLKPQTIRRIFAETACAVAYLHKNNIVHRDIKLENVLVNIPFERLVYLDQFGSAPLITLTDFGLSRTIDPENPLLTTRCGSEDYVPPELLIGLPYDGRQSDSWALGVLLYAIMESRLPFDPPPSKSIRARSKVAHRIARIEWAWSIFEEENKNVSWKDTEWDGAKWIVENLLVRREKRLTSREICDTEWVNGILPSSFKSA